MFAKIIMNKIFFHLQCVASGFCEVSDILNFFVSHLICDGDDVGTIRHLGNGLDGVNFGGGFGKFINVGTAV